MSRSLLSALGQDIALRATIAGPAAAPAAVLPCPADSFGYPDHAEPPLRRLVYFELTLGRIVLLLGPNGAGKSTLFDLLERLRRLVVDGARIDDCFTCADLTDWETCCACASRARTSA